LETVDDVDELHGHANARARPAAAHVLPKRDACWQRL
jgi:hypothetical protein